MHGKGRAKRRHDDSLQNRIAILPLKVFKSPYEKILSLLIPNTLIRATARIKAVLGVSFLCEVV